MFACSDKRFRFLMVSALSTSLAGCMGGGGGESAAVASAPPPAVYKTPSVNFSAFAGEFTSEGLASHVTVTGQAGVNNSMAIDTVAVTPGSSRGSFKTTATAPSGGNPATIAIVSPEVGSMTGALGTITSNGADQYVGGGTGSNQNDYLSVTNALKSSLGTTTLSYAYVGEGSIGKQTSSGQSFSFDGYMFNLFGGQKTHISDMPTTGTANYEGAFKGKELLARPGFDPISSDLDGRANLTANFAANTVTGTIDNLRDYQASDATPTYNARKHTISLNGAISGNQFSGTAALAGTAYPSAQQSGTVQGGFFGPKAAEAAGALAVKFVYDTRNNISSTALVTGAFGAKKQ